MKKSDLEQGMLVQTEHNRYGFVELGENRIDFCYDPSKLDEYKHLDRISLDDVFEYGEGKLGVGFIVTEEEKEKYPDTYRNFEVGAVCIMYEIVAAYKVLKVYDSGTGVYPGIMVDTQ